MRTKRRSGQAGQAGRRLAVAASVTLLAPIAWLAHGQDAPVNGMREADLRVHAIEGATIVVSPTKTIENGTIVMRDGVIEAVGAGVAIPAEARVRSGEGLTVYAGFIDAAVLHDYAVDETAIGRHWNANVHPELRVADEALPPTSLRSQLRSQGFTAAAFYPKSGLVRGTGAVLSTNEDDKYVLTYDDQAATVVGLGRSGFGAGGYPGSLMGIIALIRQTFSDAQWYEQAQTVYNHAPGANEPPRQEDSLAALGDAINRRQTVLFDVADELNAARAKRIADEFGLDLWVLGGGTEFRRLDDVTELGCPVIVPLNYPKRPEVTTLHEADKATLRDMMTWEQAPTNARRLTDAGVQIALTTERLDNRGGFIKALQSAVKHGLEEQEALAAITTTPAKLLGLDNVMGTVARGKVANLVVTEKSLFEKDSKIRDVWVNGRRFEINAADDSIELKLQGMLTTSLGLNWPVTIDTTKKRFELEVAPFDDPGAEEDGQDLFQLARKAASLPPGVELEDEDDDEDEGPSTIKAKNVVVQRDNLSCLIDGDAFYVRGYVHLSGAITDGTYVGTGALPDGSRFTFTVTDVEALTDSDGNGSATEDAANNDNSGDETPTAPASIAGTWSAMVEGADLPEPMPMVFKLTETGGAVSGTMQVMGLDMPINSGSFDRATGKLTLEISGPEGESVTINATVSGDQIEGGASTSMGQIGFSGSREGGAAPRAARSSQASSNRSDDSDFVMPPQDLPVPFGAYGVDEAPKPQSVLVHSATIWTSGPKGVIDNSWMLVRNGKIAQIGSGGYPKIAVDHVIDAQGKHVTPGLIDCHSHTGMSGGVNEGGQVNTAEVRVDDIINPDDINWYRELAGGLTAANQLHGSANPIGGQNSAVKLKWGGNAEDFRIEDDHVGIKFALGENVKRSTSRYPNTRMGVETTIRDAFTAAQLYDERWKAYNVLSESQRLKTMPPRRDLELEALVEILRGDRLVHCHSYRQDEILMLMRLAESFGFHIGTFQHILEGYKVGDVMAEHGASGSSFSDWWAYKVEVMDAIPYNGAILHNLGVVVSFNSDSNELARRMNDEAAKAVRYGDVDPSEALKFVTLNPAKQLGIDHRTGSLEVGKDADFVIWSTDPLSSYSRCEQTWIEGACYYSKQMHRDLATQANRERQRLIQKILADAHGEAPSMNADEEEVTETSAWAQSDRIRDRIMARMVEQARAWMLEQVRLGRDPEEIRPGQCGCNDYILTLMELELQR